MEEDNRKSRLVAGLLGVFVGSLGIHNFYLGYKDKGLTQIILTFGSVVVSTALWILAGILSIIIIGFFIMPIAFLFSIVPFGIWVWGLIEGIMLLCGNINTDAEGNPLKD